MGDQVEPVSCSESDLDISLEIFSEPIVDDKKNLGQLQLTGMKIDYNSGPENNGSPILDKHAMNIVKAEMIEDSKDGITEVEAERIETNITIEKEEVSSDESIESELVDRASHRSLDSSCDSNDGITSRSESEGQGKMVKKRKKLKSSEKCVTNSHSENNDESESEIEQNSSERDERQRSKKCMNTDAEKYKKNTLDFCQPKTMDDQVEPLSCSESELDISLEIFPEPVVDDKKDLEQLQLTGMKIDYNSGSDNNKSPILEEHAMNIVKAETIEDSKDGITEVEAERIETNITIEKEEVSSDESIESELVDRASCRSVDSSCDSSDGITSRSESEGQGKMVKKSKKLKSNEKFVTNSHSENNDESESEIEENSSERDERHRSKKCINTDAEKDKKNTLDFCQPKTMDDQVEPLSCSESELDISLELFPEPIVDDKKNLEQLQLTGMKIDYNSGPENNKSPILEEHAMNIVKAETIADSKDGIREVEAEGIETNITVEQEEVASDESIDSELVDRASRRSVDSSCDSSDGITSRSESQGQAKMVQKRKKLKSNEKFVTNSHSENNDESESEIEENSTERDEQHRSKKCMNTDAEKDRNNSKSENEADNLHPCSSTMNKKKDPAENTMIKNLKRYLNTAGIRVSYKKLWSGSESDRERARRMTQLLKERGIKGRPTLKKCRRLKSSNELKLESAELNPQNIISKDRITRARRSETYEKALQRTSIICKPNSLYDSDTE